MNEKYITKEWLSSSGVDADCQEWLLKYLGTDFLLSDLSKVRGDYMGYIKCLQAITWSGSITHYNMGGVDDANTVDANTPVKSCTYNKNGDILYMRKANGDWCEYLYNRDGNVKQVKGNTYTDVFYYDEYGRLTAIFRNGMCELNLLGVYTY